MASLGELIRRKRQDETATNRILGHLLTTETANKVGTVAGNIDAEAAQRREGKLKNLINEGKLSPDQLGPRDRMLVGKKFLQHYAEVPQPGKGTPSFLGVGGPLGESLSNFASGLVSFGKNLPGGIYTTGKAIGQDVAHDVTNPEDAAKLGLGVVNPIYGVTHLSDFAPHVSEEIVDPTIQYYKEKYGQGSLHDIARRALIEDPFGTALDVGTLATLGAGAAGKAGAIAGRAGETLEASRAGEGLLGKIGTGLREGGNYFKQYGYRGTRGTREPLQVGKNIAPIKREYGASPLVRAGQRLSDKYLQDVPGVGPKLAEWRGRLAQNHIINTLAGRERIQGSFEAARQSKDMVKAAKALDGDESIALTLLKNGVNMQAARPRGGIARGNISMLDRYKEMLNASIENKLPAGSNIQQMPGVDPQIAVDLRAKLDDPNLVKLIQEPTDKMVHASDVWDEQVQRNLETHGIEPEEHIKRVFGPQEALRSSMKDLHEAGNAAEMQAVKDPMGAFQRFSAQHQAETGQEFPIAPNYVPHEIAEGTYAGDLTNIKRPKPVPGVRFAYETIRRDRPKFLTENEMQAFLSGAMRTGPGPMIRQISEREHALAREGTLNELDRLTEKDPKTGDTLTAASDAEMEKMGFSRRTHVRVPLDGLARVYKDQVNFMKLTADVVGELLKDSPDEVAQRLPQITESLHQAADNSAEATMLNVTGLTKPEMPIMTREAANHLKHTFDAMMPDPLAFGRGYDRLISYWRTALLAASPRWWINTFVGSAFLTALSGAAKPRYFRAAWRYGGRGERAAELMKVAPELRPGLVGAEVHENELLYHGRKGPFQKVFTHVENMESFFKRAGFFKQLDEQAKARMRQMGEPIDEFTHIGKMRDEYISQLLHDPDFVSHSLDGVNKFYYNYTSLGPLERRWVRRFVPFWGWYKFVTKLIWQLPFQYPGRTLVLDKLSKVAGDFEQNELGILPNTIKGAIFLNNNRNNEEYIPTFGLNPFSDFANPASPEGTMAGLVSSQQLAPFIGAFLESQGVDPYRGTPAELSPESGLLEGRFGSVLNPETGEEVPGGKGSADALQRFLGSLLRDIPQVRTLETLSQHGRYVYPESIPFINEKPIPVEEGEAYGQEGSPLEYAIRSLVGAAPPKNENLREYQKTLREEFEAGRSHRKSQMKLLRKAGVR